MNVSVSAACHADFIAGVGHIHRVLDAGAGCVGIGAGVFTIRPVGDDVADATLGTGDGRLADHVQQSQRSADERQPNPRSKEERRCR